MKARLFLICLLFAGLLGVSGPLSVHVDVKRTSLDLLDPVSFIISVINSGKKPIVASFTTTDLYDIGISAHGKEVWAWSKAHSAAQVLRTYTFTPGRTVLITHIWDALSGRQSIAPGDYVAHVRLMDSKYHPSVDAPLQFALPTPVHGALELPFNSSVTVSGTLKPIGTRVQLVDASGAIGLSKRIAMVAPNGTFVVRGYLTKQNGEVFLSVDRWARTLDNPEPALTAPPLPVAPTPRRTPHP
ncbi:MAG: BsuPI-related putative proteinase inhibitor [Candidatus Baltobacteraceae bacterium]